MLFTVFMDGTVRGFSLQTQEYHIYTGGNSSMHDVRRLAVDYENQLIYIIAKVEYGTYTYHRLLKLNYNDTDLTTLYKGIELNNAFSLDVFKDTVVWITTNIPSMHSMVFKCQPASTCKNPKQLYYPFEVST